jgi:6-pyruvoyltetrahydropterin/6-carboxytetrahydropterin synthase
MMYITRKTEFCASHRLFNPAFSDEKNTSIYGPCANPNGHGHNYFLEVTIEGDVVQDTGMVFEFGSLKKLIEEEVIRKVDHKNLNVDVEFLRDIIPTAENMAVTFWNILDTKITDGRLYELKLYESDRNFVVYRGKNCAKPNSKTN